MVIFIKNNGKLQKVYVLFSCNCKENLKNKFSSEYRFIESNIFAVSERMCDFLINEWSRRVKKEDK